MKNGSPWIRTNSISLADRAANTRYQLPASTIGNEAASSGPPLSIRGMRFPVSLPPEAQKNGSMDSHPLTTQVKVKVPKIAPVT